MKYFVDKGLDIPASKSEHLHNYVKNPRSTLEGIKYLVDNGINIHAKDAFGNTLFHTYAKIPTPLWRE